MPGVWAWTLLAASGATRNSEATGTTNLKPHLGDDIQGSPYLCRGGESIKRGGEPVVAKHGGGPLVVDGRIGIDPVAPRIDRECQHLCQGRTLHQQLLGREQAA